MARKSRYADKTDHKLLSITSAKFTAGLYLRLSVADGDDLENNSIGNQKKICMDFLKAESDIQVGQVYMDNGCTGMNYQRPGYQEMLCDLQAGKINCVIVKDISRLGRNYILTSELIEKTLPEMGVRFICVNDSFDSFHPGADHESILMPFKMIMNDSYVKDTSRKIRSSIRTKMDCGAFLPSASSIPYGYQRMPAQNTFSVDEEAAKIIVRIYEMRADGKSFHGIARILNEEGIPSPGKLRYLRGMTDTKRFENALWVRGTIRKIATDPVYLGHRIHGKVKRDRLAAEKKKRTQEEWQMIQNTHPAIIPQELFDSVQKVNQSELERRAHYNSSEAPAVDYRDIFKGKVFCADCLRAMGNLKQTQRLGSELPNHYVFECNSYTNSGHQNCFTHYTPHETVMKALENMLNQQLETAVDVEQLLADIKNRPDVHRNQDHLNDELVSTRVRRMNMEAKKERLFGDYVEGILTKPEYEQMKQKYDHAHKVLCEEEKEIMDQAAAFGHLVDNTQKWVAAIKQSVKLPVIDAELVDKLVEKILVKSSKSIHISLRYSDPYAAITEYLSQIPEVMDDVG